MFHLNYPLSVQVEVTESCDHFCFYCYNYWRPVSSKSNMSIENAKRLSDILINDIKPFSVTITGGEPLFNLEAVLLLSKGLFEHGRSYNLNTHLALLDKDILGRLQEASPRFGILASLPHFKEDIYKKITRADDFNKIYQNLKYILDNTSLPITMNMVVHQLNKDDVYNEGKYLFERFGLKSFAATPMLQPPYKGCGSAALSQQEIGEVLEDLVRLHYDFGIQVDSLETIPRCVIPEAIRNSELSLFNRACSAGRSTLSVGYDGSVRACSHTPFGSGNIFREGFRKIWEKFKPFRDNAFVPPDCLDCAEFYSCYGGCRVCGFKKGDKLNKRDPRMNEKISQIKPIKRELLDVLDGKEYEINPQTTYRQEQENLYTFFNGKFMNVLFVNEEFKEFIERLRALGRFKPQSLCCDENLQDKAKRLMQILISREYLRPC